MLSMSRSRLILSRSESRLVGTWFTLSLIPVGGMVVFVESSGAGVLVRVVGKVRVVAFVVRDLETVRWVEVAEGGAVSVDPRENLADCGS